MSRRIDPDVLKQDMFDDLWGGFIDGLQGNASQGNRLVEPDGGIMEWIQENQLVNEKGKVLEYTDHAFLVDIMNDLHPLQVIKKCAQIGFSVTTVLKDIYLAYFKNYTIIYTLPTREMVFEYVPTKVDIIIDKNPILQQMVVNKDSSTQKKRVGDGFILYKGTFGEREAIMTSSDLNTYDECDRSNLNVIEGLESRLGSSDYKGQWWFSNPTFPNVGVCKHYERSDQRKWHVICPHCNKEIVLDWYGGIVDYEQAIYVCPKCLREISDDTRRNGFWYPHQPGSDIHGYHISKVMVPWVPCSQMIRWEMDKTPENFHNFDLGEGYMDGTKQITKDIIESCEASPPSKYGYLAVGIDQGTKFHCVIGPRSGIARIVTLDTWEQVEALIKPDNIRAVVIDAQPERRDAAKLAKKYPYKVWNCYYVDDPKRPADLDSLIWTDSEGIVKAERTMTIDETVHRFHRKDINIYLDKDYPQYKKVVRKGESFIEQWENMFVAEKEGNMGNLIRRWEHSGPDHWAHATNYWNMAVQKLPKQRRSKQSTVHRPRNPYTGY